MLEQEIASIIKWILDTAGKPFPYYWEVPADFAVPAVYFPMPEIDTGGETFFTYNMDYVWYIKIFHRTKEDAHSLALSVVTALRAARNLVPLIAEDGSKMKGSWIRLNDPKLKILDDGVAQLTVSWRSRRPYNTETAGKAASISLSMFEKSYGKTAIGGTMESALSQ